MNAHLARVAIVIHAIAVVVSPGRLDAQAFPTFGGIDVRVGAAVPINAKPGLSASADLDLGSLRVGSLRAIAGGHYFAADRDVAGDADAGSYTALGGRLGLRLDLFGAQRFSPYILGAVTGHSVSADVADPETGALLEGFYVGASLGIGAAYSIDPAGRLSVTGEARRTFVSNIDHYAFELGIRLQPRGSDTYARRPEDPWARDAAGRRIDERELREQERLAAERARDEQERLARMTDEERRRADERARQAARETDLAREQAAAAEQARRAEAEARERAERAAAAAGEREAEAARAAREAEARAAEAEQRLYDSLLELDRLIANVIEIRDTERGIAVVVGQGLFATGQSSLSGPARDEVGRIAAVLRQFSEHAVSVEGHTDAVGSEVANQRLSEQRAEAVRAALIAAGIDPARVTAVGYGQNRPIADNATAAGRAQNRRVEIVILGARRPVRPTGSVESSPAGSGR
jgi:outer membrane protein OmpA-like peptidoglycan-associated protein